jgi:hypothetical protein
LKADPPGASQNRQAVLMQRMAEMGGRLESMVKTLSAFTVLTEIPARLTTIKEAVKDVTSTLVKQLGDVAGCSILIYDPFEDRLELIAASGQEDLFSNEKDKNFNRTLYFKPGEGIAGKVFKDNKPIFWDRNSLDAGLIKRDPRLKTPLSLAALPLTHWTPTLGCSICPSAISNPSPILGSGS